MRVRSSLANSTAEAKINTSANSLSCSRYRPPVITTSRVTTKLKTRLDAISNEIWRRMRSGIVQSKTTKRAWITSTVQNTGSSSRLACVSC